MGADDRTPGGRGASRQPRQRKLFERAWAKGVVAVTLLKIMGVASVGMFVSCTHGSACPTFTVRETGNMQDPELDEVSGIVVSGRDDAIWMEEDSDNEPALYATNRAGDKLGEWTIDGAKNVDWEDLSLGPEGDLFVGDIGDNPLSRSRVVIYRVPEPRLPGSGTIPLKAEYTMSYVDGEHNAEAMFVHGRSVFIITKDQRGRIYRASFGSQTLRPVGTLGLSTVTAADMRGDVIVVQSYSRTWWFSVNGSVVDTLTGPHCSVPNDGGEAVAIAPQLAGYYMIPEGPYPPIRYASRT